MGVEDLSLTPPRRVIITGAGGFVGSHVARAFGSAWPDAMLIRVGHEPGPRIDVVADVRDPQAMSAIVQENCPDVILHLAAVSHQLAAHSNPAEAWAVNLHGTVNVGEAALRFAPDAFMIYASTGEVYGRSFQEQDVAAEDCPLAPMNLYALTKAAADLAVCELACRGLRTLRLRLFNHTGPGQAANFAISAFARQIAFIEQGLLPPVLSVGTLDRWRDFLDVRDVTSAYVAAVRARERLDPDAVLNICSGQAKHIGAILNELVSMGIVSIEVRSDPAPRAAYDLPRSVGNPTKAHAALGWRPSTPWRDTLSSVLEYWRNIAAAASGRD